MSQFIEMFEGNKYPHMSLEEISIEWLKGQPFKKDDIIVNGATPCIHYGELFTKYGPIINDVSSTTNISPKKTSKAGDILFPASDVTPNGLARCSMLSIDNVILGGDIIVLRPNNEYDPGYLSYAINQQTSQLLKRVNGGVVKHLSAKALKTVQIPIPPKDKQEEYISIAEQADKSGFVGLKSQFIEMFGNPLASIQKYPLKKLGECCKLNPRRPSLDLEDTDKVSFVPMPSVSENGYLQDVIDEEYGKVKKGFTYFKNNDVLFAKITPCMENGKGAIAEGLTNNIGMGSTEFHVLRPIEGKSNPFWLLALTRLPIFRERATKNMSGTGGQKRVPATYLENFMVGLPPIEEQNRFENIYNQADKSGFELRKSIDAIDAVIKSLINN